MSTTEDNAAPDSNALISESYREQNIQLHQDHAAYGTKAHRYVKAVANLIVATGLRRVLDYGCGKGVLKPALEKLLPTVRVAEYDPAIAGKDSDPDPQDLVVVFDVMEHIEPDLLDNVLSHVQSKTITAALFLISNVPAKKVLPDGRNAHLIVEDKVWWEAKLSAYFDVKEVVDAEVECIIACRHKS